MAVTGERAVVVLVVAALVVYAVAAAVAHRWITAAAAPVVGVLLATRHPRARFSAYVLFSAVAVRGLVAGDWALVGFGVAGVLVLQLPAARRAWPRLAPGRTRASRST
jgi:hypothetical protein